MEYMRRKLPKIVSTFFGNSRAEYKTVYAMWKTSGNGSGNRSVQIRGTTYEDNVIENRDEVINVDDDRAGFCHNIGIHIGYFWCLSEMCGVCQHMTQDCSAIGLSSTSKPQTLKDRFKKRHLAKRARMSKHDKAMETMESLLLGVKEIVGNKKEEEEKLTDVAFGQTLQENLRSAKSDFVFAQEREEKLYEMIAENKKMGM